MDYKNPSESTTIHYHPLESSGVTLFSIFFPQLELEPLLGAERNAIAANIGSLFQSIGCFHGGLRRLALSSDVAIWFPMSSPDVLLLFLLAAGSLWGTQGWAPLFRFHFCGLRGSLRLPRPVCPYVTDTGRFPFRHETGIPISAGGAWFLFQNTWVFIVAKMFQSGLGPGSLTRPLVPYTKPVSIRVASTKLWNFSLGQYLRCFSLKASSSGFFSCRFGIA